MADFSYKYLPPNNSIYNENKKNNSVIVEFINYKHNSVFICDLIKLLEQAIFE